MTVTVFLLSLAACGSEAARSGDLGPTELRGLTFYKDIKPLIDDKCLSCHREGGIAPFSFSDYAQVHKLRGAIHNAVQSRTMPPWLAADGCNDYVGDISLSQAQIDKISAWVDDDAPAGDIADAQPAATAKKTAGLSRVDMALTLPVKYTPRKSPDDYRCFIIDWPQQKDAFVSGYHIAVDNDAIVHHVLLFAVKPSAIAQAQKLDDADPGPGYSCFGGPGIKFSAGGGGGQLLGGWAPGSPGGDFPAGTGIRVEAGSKLIVQMHYNTVELRDDISDQSTIELKIDDAVEKEATAQFFTNPYWANGGGMPIRAGEKDASHSFAWDLTKLVGDRPINVYTANLHMHRLGTQARLEVLRKNGQKTCLLDIPRWDFDWQRSYALKKPVTMHPGDKLSIRCQWDNSAANQPVVDGEREAPRTVNWGEGTGDEMCLGSVLLTYGD